MLIAFELKYTLQQANELSGEEVGWWLAFFKHKNELERKAQERANRRA